MMKAVAAAVLGNSFFGLSFLFSKVALERLEPFVLLAVRFIVAFVMLNLVLLTGKVKIRLTGKPVQKILMLGLVQPVLYFTFENYGIRGTSTAFAGTLLAIVPVITLIAGVLFRKEIPSRLQVFGAVLSVIGVAVISLAQQRGSNEAGGVAFLFCAVVSSVGYNLLMRDTADSFTSFERTYVMIGLGSLFFTCFLVIQSGGALGRLAPKMWGLMGPALPAAVGAGRLGEYFLSGGIFFSRSIFPPELCIFLFESGAGQYLY